MAAKYGLFRFYVDPFQSCLSSNTDLNQFDRAFHLKLEVSFKRRPDGSMKTHEAPVKVNRRQRNVYERRAYAALRAAIAIERISRVAGPISPSEKAQALRWMKAWISFVTARRM